MLLIEQKLVCMSQQETSAIAMRKLAKHKGKDKDKDLEYTIDGKFLIYLKIKPSSVKSLLDAYCGQKAVKATRCGKRAELGPEGIKAILTMVWQGLVSQGLSEKQLRSTVLQMHSLFNTCPQADMAMILPV